MTSRIFPFRPGHLFDHVRLVHDRFDVVAEDWVLRELEQGVDAGLLKSDIY